MLGTSEEKSVSQSTDSIAIAARKRELYVKVFKQEFIRELQYLWDVANDRAQARDSFAVKLGKQLQSLAPRVPMVEGVVDKLGSVLEFAGNRERDKCISVIANLADELDLSQLEILLDIVAREALRRYESFIINRLSTEPEEGVIPFARVGARRVLEKLSRSGKALDKGNAVELTEALLLAGLIEGRSGSFVEGFSNHKLTLQQTRKNLLGKIVPRKAEAEDVYARSGLRQLYMVKGELKSELFTRKGARHKEIPSWEKVQQIFKGETDSLYNFGYVKPHKKHKHDPKTGYAIMPQTVIRDRYDFEPQDEKVLSTELRAELQQQTAVSTIIIDRATLQHYLQWSKEQPGKNILDYIRLSHAGVQCVQCQESLIGLDLQKANLSHMDLSGATLSGDLAGTDFSHSYLIGTKLVNITQARHANFRHAHCEFLQAMGVDFSSADFTQAYFDYANLRGTNLSGCKTLGTRWSYTDLSGVKSSADLLDEHRTQLQQLEYDAQTQRQTLQATQQTLIEQTKGLYALQQQFAAQLGQPSTAGPATTALEQKETKAAIVQVEQSVASQAKNLTDLNAQLQSLIQQQENRQAFEIYCQGELTTLQQSLQRTASKTEIEDLKIQLVVIQKQLQALQTATPLKEALAAFKTELETQMKTLGAGQDALKKNLLTLQNQFSAQLENQVKTQAERFAQLKTEMATLEQTLSARLKQLEGRVSVLEQWTETTQATLGGIKADNDDLRSITFKLDTQIADLAAKQRAQIQNQAIYQAQLAEVQQRMSTAKHAEELALLKTQLRLLEKKLTEVSEPVTAPEVVTQLATLESVCAKQKVTSEKQQKQLAELGRSLPEKLNQYNTAHQVQITELQKALEATQTQLEARLAKVEKRVDELESWANQTAQELAGIKLEHKEDHAQLQTVQAELKKWVAEQRDQQTKQKNYRTGMLEIQAKITQAADKRSVEQLRTELNQLEEKFQKHLNDNKPDKTAQVKLNSLEQALTKLTQSSATTTSQLRSDSEKQQKRLAQIQQEFSKRLNEQTDAQASAQTNLRIIIQQNHVDLDTRLVAVEKRVEHLESWAKEAVRDLADLKLERKEEQGQIRGIQEELKKWVAEQQQQQAEQLRHRETITELQKKIPQTTDKHVIDGLKKEVRQLEEKFQKSLSAGKAGEAVQAKLTALEQALEKLTKAGATMNNQLRAEIEKQQKRLAQIQQEVGKGLAEQVSANKAAVEDLQAQLQQTAASLDKRLEVLAGRVDVLEVKQEAASPEYRLAVKLQKLRQRVLMDAAYEETLALYVPPNGQAEPGGERSALASWMDTALLNGTAQVALLQGKAGAGKSTFNRYLQRTLWQHSAWEKFMPGMDTPSAYVPIFIELNAPDCDPTDLFGYLQRLPNLSERFLPDELAVLCKDYNVLLIADGYDEMRGKPTVNLYDTNHLADYAGHVKLVIGCRAPLPTGLREETHFMPHDASGKSQPARYCQRYVAPFDERQIADYLQRYLDKNKSAPGWDLKRYQTAIAALPELRDLITTPFLLRITAEVLPEIMTEMEQAKESKTASVDIRLTRAKLFDKFMGNWFKREAKKAWDNKNFIKKPDTFLDSPTLKQLDTLAKQNALTEAYEIEVLKRCYVQFCKLFAEKLVESGIKTIEYPRSPSPSTTTSGLRSKLAGKPQVVETVAEWVHDLLAEDDTDLVRVRQGSPLRKESNQHGFLHDTMVDYFFTTQLWEHAIAEIRETKQALPKPAPKPEELLPPPVLPPKDLYADEHKGDSKRNIKQDPQSDKTLPSPLPPKDLYADEHKADNKRGNPTEIKSPRALYKLNERLLNPDQIAFLADRVTHDATFKTHLFAWIECSKADDSLSISAANAITILNAAGVSFAGMDFSHVHIPGANLTDALLEGVRLVGADLRGVHLDGAWLRGADLSGADLENVHVSELPSLTLSTNVQAAAYTRDGKLLAVALYDSITLYRVADFQVMAVLKGHTDCINALSFDATGTYLASASDDGAVRLWQVSDGHLAHLIPHDSAVRCVAFDSTGHRLVTGGADQHIRIWSVQDGRLLTSFNAHEGSIRAACFTPHNQLVTGAEDNTVKVWSLHEAKEAKAKLEHTLTSHTDYVTALALDMQGQQLASSGYDGSVRIWSVPEFKPLQVLADTDTSTAVTQLAFDAAGKRLVVGLKDGNVHVSSVDTGKRLRSLKGHTDAITHLQVGSHGEIITASLDNQVRFWTLDTPAALRHFDSHSEAVRCLAVGPKTGTLISGSSDKTVRLWSIPETKCVYTFKGHDSGVTAVALDRTEKLAASGSWDSTVRLWSLPERRLLTTFTDHTNDVLSVAFAHQTDVLASSSRDNTINLWSYAAGKYARLHTLDMSQPVPCVTFLPGDTFVLAAGEDYTVQAWSLKTQAQEFSLTPPSMPSDTDKLPHTWLATDSKGEFAVTAGEHALYIWSLTTQKCLHTLSHHTAHITAASFDPSGKWLASTSWDKTLCIWNVASGQCQLVLKDFLTEINSVVWIPAKEGWQLATATDDQAVRLWHLTERDGKLSAQLSWSSAQAPLYLKDAKLEGAKHLTKNLNTFFKQRGATGASAGHASEKGGLESKTTQAQRSTRQ